MHPALDRPKSLRPSARNAATSPSSTTRPRPTRSAKGASSGYAALTSLPLRLTNRVRPPSTNASTRTPSHLTS